jgi:hypothetical protein
MFGRKKNNTTPDAVPANEAVAGDARSNSDRTLTNPWNDYHPSKDQIKRATRTRYIWALLSSFLLLISVVFLILVEIGNIGDQTVIRDTYFINLDLSNIIPVSIPNAVLINSIARTIGLHDFYRVGLWNFCEGYNGEGITYCSNPKTLWWFNPVEIISNELVAGATSMLFHLLGSRPFESLANTIAFFSRPSSRHNHNPQPSPPRLKLDVRPFPRRRLHKLPHDLPDPLGRLFPLGHLPDRNLHFCGRPVHDCRDSARHRLVHHHEKRHHVCGADQHWRTVGHTDVCVHLDRSRDKHNCFCHSDRTMLLLR